MDDAARPEGWFLGDLDDPWVVAIAAALPNPFVRISLVGDLPGSPPWLHDSSSVVVLHRPTLSLRDYECLVRLRRDGCNARLIVCVGAQARYAHVQRWSVLTDAILPEATAPEVIARYVWEALGQSRGQDDSPRSKSVVVVGDDREISRWLDDVCTSAGYRSVPARRWEDAAEAGSIALWPVPVLEQGWPDRLAQEAKHRRVITLIGLADRELVQLSRARGAAACLDLPCDPADLVFVLDRLSGGSIAAAVPNDPPHRLGGTGRPPTTRPVVGMPSAPYNIGGPSGRPRPHRRTPGAC